MKKELMRLVVEEVTKSEIKSMITNDRPEIINSKEFKEKVKDISSKVLEELFKILWTRKSFWLDQIKK